MGERKEEERLILMFLNKVWGERLPVTNTYLLNKTNNLGYYILQYIVFFFFCSIENNHVQ